MTAATADGRPDFGAPDFERLDALLDDAGIDVLVATSRHAVMHLLGGYQHFQFATMEAIGIGRYLPALVYVRGRPAHAAYVAARNERDALANAAPGQIWPPTVLTAPLGGAPVMAAVAAHLKDRVGGTPRIGVERAFLPMDAADALRAALPGATLVDALRVLELWRAIKTPAELALLRRASEQVVAAMGETFAQSRPGDTKQAIIDRLRAAEERRGLVFDYALVTLGTSHNRAPSAQELQPGDVV
jgi:Xaa-Pro aminopeptidase